MAQGFLPIPVRVQRRAFPAASHPGGGSAKLLESFENVGAVPAGAFGPQNLMQAGWIFRWSASDDGEVREIRLHASYDGERTWHGVASVPGDASGFAWKLPDSAGVPGARLRVSAVDRRFRNSTDEIPLTILAGTGGDGRKKARRAPGFSGGATSP